MTPMAAMPDAIQRAGAGYGRTSASVASPARDPPETVARSTTTRAHSSNVPVEVVRVEGSSYLSAASKALWSTELTGDGIAFFDELSVMYTAVRPGYTIARDAKFPDPPDFV